METNIKLLIFGDVDVPGREKVNVGEIINELESLEHSDVARQMVESGVFVPDVKNPKFGDLYFPSFLNEDLTINLEKLELALILSVRLLDKITKGNKIFLFLSGWNNYFELREIYNDSRRRGEETSFVWGFANSVLGNESIELAEEGGEKSGAGKYQITVINSP